MDLNFLFRGKRHLVLIVEDGGRSHLQVALASLSPATSVCVCTALDAYRAAKELKPFLVIHSGGLALTDIEKNLHIPVLCSIPNPQEIPSA
jgi:hypothetical protein